MSKVFNLSVISPEKVVYEGKVVSLVVPSALGYLGVLANHAPFISNLVSGKIIVREESGKTVVFQYQGKGFFEVLKNNAVVILQQALTA